VTSNNTQGETLAKMPNSFELENHMWCFNHTLHLSVKTLLCPFNIGLGKTTKDGNNTDIDNLLDNDNDSLPDAPNVNDINDGIDELDALDEDE
jgi:hypothetical protein